MSVTEEAAKAAQSCPKCGAWAYLCGGHPWDIVRELREQIKGQGAVYDDMRYTISRQLSEIERISKLYDELLLASKLPWVHRQEGLPAEGEFVLGYWMTTSSWSSMYAVVKHYGNRSDERWEGPNVPSFQYRPPDYWRLLPTNAPSR